jgi:hypothetical protein
MSTTYESLEGEAETDLYQEIETLIKKSPWAWQSVCAVVGLVGSVIAPILGATTDVITWFAHSQSLNSHLHVLSIVFCALTLPLIILGAFCLDSLQRKTTKLSPPAESLRDKSATATSISHIANQNTNHSLNRTSALVVMVFLLALHATARARLRARMREAARRRRRS